jgi:hypothetical protein
MLTVSVFAPSVAEMENNVMPPGGVVDNVAVAEVAPAGITSVVGSVALPEVEPRVIVVPPTGAGPLIVTVTVAELPPTIVVCEAWKLTSCGAATIRPQLLVTPLRVAVI